MNDQQETYQAHKQTGLLLNANEASENLSEELVSELQAMLPDILFNRYPEDACTELKKQYGKQMGLPENMIICGNGSDQMLQLLITSFLSEGKTLFTLSPDFSMYDFYVSAIGGNVKRYPLLSPQISLNETVFDVDDFIHKARESGADLVMFSNPNNPTGLMISPEEVSRIAKALAPVPVVLDEAYMEFGEDSALDLLNTPEHENLYITRTLSKAFSLAGLRVGFLISSPENIAALDPKRPVYNLNSFSSAAACRVLAHADEFAEKTRKVIGERKRLIDRISQMNHLTCTDSKGNFIPVSICHDSFEIRKDLVEQLVNAFDEQGITIRNYPGRDYLRITVGLEDENNRTIQILEDFNRMLEEER